MEKSLFEKQFQYILSLVKNHRLFITFIIVFNCILIKFVFLDLWNDEVYTFQHFVLQSYSTIVSDYHVPNNHILNSLLYKLYTDTLGFHTMYDVLSHPFQLRLLQVFIANLSVYYLYKFCTYAFNKTIAYLSIIILISTIPYLNFALQIRAYNFSIFWMLQSLYFISNFIQTFKKKYVFYLLLSTALWMYSVPSNIYFIIPLLIFFSVKFCIDFFGKKEHTSKLYSIDFLIIASIVFGLLLSFLFYWPVFKNVFSNEYVTYSPFLVSNIVEYFPRVTLHFLTHREFVFIPFLLICFLKIGFTNIPFKQYFFLLILIYVVPFLLVFLLGNNVPDRVFVTLSPVFSIIIAVSINVVFTSFKLSKVYQSATYILLSVYMLCNLYVEFQKVDLGIYKDLFTNGRRQDLYYNYYLAHFFPNSEVKSIKNKVKYNHLPIAIVGCEPHDIPHYLEAYDLKYSSSENTVDSLKKQIDSFLIVTNHPHYFNSDSIHNITILSNQISYHTFILCTKR